MEVQKVEKLGQLLEDFLGPNKTVTDHESIRLTAAGENYGSTMLALKIDVKNGVQNEILEAVGKVPPPGEFIQRMFNIPVTFRNEIKFYQVIVPELKNFLDEKGVDRSYLDCFPEFYGARLNFNNNELANDDAVLLLENLKVLGYEGVDRTVGFDLETAKMILQALAKYHAVPVAMKILKPETFRNKIRPLFALYKVFEMDGNMRAGVMEKMKKTVEGIETCKQYVSKVVDILNSSQQFFDQPKNCPDFVREPFATIIHTDAWVNNFMVKFANGKPTNCKIVDFQLGEYGSPARDVVFFIFTSVQIPVVRQHYDELIDLYHQTFVEILEKLQCDIAPFSREAFQKEIEIVSIECEFSHCMIMLDPIFATKDSVKELDEYKEEDMTQQKEIPQKHQERAEYIISEFIKRNFI